MPHSKWQFATAANLCKIHMEVVNLDITGDIEV